MIALPTFAITAMLSLAPARDHAVLGEAMARKVEAEPAFVPNDADKTLTLSVLISVAFRESSLRASIEGDHDKDGKPTSFCAFQIHLPYGARTREGWTGADLNADVDRCVAVGFRLLRDSFDACRAEPVEERLAWYARGRCGSKEGRRLSRDRLHLARSIAKQTRAALEPSSSSLFLRATATRLCAIHVRRWDDASIAAGWS